MKKIIVLTLATLISSHAMASNFTCEPHYRAKVEKLSRAQYDEKTLVTMVGASWAVPVSMGVAGFA